MNLLEKIQASFFLYFFVEKKKEEILSIILKYSSVVFSNKKIPKESHLKK